MLFQECRRLFPDSPALPALAAALEDVEAALARDGAAPREALEQGARSAAVAPVAVPNLVGRGSSQFFVAGGPAPLPPVALTATREAVAAAHREQGLEPAAQTKL